MFLVQGRYADALVQLNRSVELRPNPEAFNNLGNAYFVSRRYSDAATAFRRGLNLDDTDWITWGNLGDSLYWTGTQRPQALQAYQNAIERGEKRLEINPKDATVLAFLANYNAMAGHRDAAEQQIERAVALAPNDAEVRFRSAIVYNQFADQDRCLAALAKALQLGYSAKVIRDTPDFDHLHGNPTFQQLTASR